MTVHVRAPMRIDFAGGWTDVETFASSSGGIVTNAAITLYARAEFLVGGNRIRLHAQDLEQHLSLASPSEIVYDGVLDLHKAALNMLPVTGGIEILTRSDAPAGAGLGGSGALDVALLSGLAHIREEGVDGVELAELGYQLETSELHLMGGRQDQYAAALGGFHELTFSGDGAAHRRLAVSQDAARDLERHLVLVYTGQSHFSPATHERVWEAYADRTSEVSEALAAIKDLGHRAAGAITAGDWKSLAAIVNENWRQQQRLDSTIATTHGLRIEAAVRRAGALGVKATGAGAGGCLVVLCPPDQRDAVIHAAVQESARVLDFAFDFDGVAVWDAVDAGDT